MKPSTNDCQKCGKTGGKVLSYQDEGCQHSRWCCPFCSSIDEAERKEFQRIAVEFAGYVLYSGSHTFLNNPYYKPFTENARKAVAFLHSLGLIEQHPTDKSSWRYVGQTEGHAKNLKASTLEILKTIAPNAVNSLLLKPIDMILPCPRCGKLHVDAPEPENGWTNPPHKSHLCHGCGFIFRPADIPTNGVAVIKTRGENDSPIPVNSNYDRQAPSSSEV
jgi:hypothetical protein